MPVFQPLPKKVKKKAAAYRAIQTVDYDKAKKNKLKKLMKDRKTY